MFKIYIENIETGEVSKESYTERAVAAKAALDSGINFRLVWIREDAEAEQLANMVRGGDWNNCE